jgi:anti-sigma regulatory factor (Ser/Thr protein kinase)
MLQAALPGPGLLHDAFFYDGEDALSATAVSFVREGVERGQVVLVNTARPLTALLRALFGHEETVVFADEPVYERPVGAIDQYKRTMDRGLAADVPGYRAIGHIDFQGSRLPWPEWLRYEAVVNRVFESYPFHALCPYSRRTVAPEIVLAMRRAHPWLVVSGRRVPNPEYVEPVELVSRPEYVGPADPLEEEPPQLELEGVRALRDLRNELYPVAIFTGMARSKVDDFVKAVGEVSANAWTHGRGTVRVRLWTAMDRLLCTVTDHGPGIADPLKGYARSIGNATTGSVSTREGLGLWAARQLCDILDYRHDEDGFTVRLVAFDG